MSSQPFYLLSREVDTLSTIMARFSIGFMTATKNELVKALTEVFERCQAVLANLAHMGPDMKVVEIIVVNQRVDQVLRAVRYWTGCIRSAHINN